MKGNLLLGKKLVFFLVGPFARCAAACFLALWLTALRTPMVWDEGNAIWRAEGILAWSEVLLGLRRPAKGNGAFDEETIRFYWRYTMQLEGHPPFYGIVIASGLWLRNLGLNPLYAARLGPIALASLALASVYVVIRSRYGRWAALLSVLGILLLPRLFAHAHFASHDGPLMCCWLFCWAVFEATRGRRWFPLLTALPLGCAMACKAPGWLTPVPLIAYTLLYRDRKALLTLLAMMPLAILVFWMLNPPLWYQPITGFARFVELNLSRAGYNISIFWFGRLYDLYHPLPWYNTVVWIAITTPVGILLLLLAGLVAIVGRWRKDRAGMLVVLEGLCLLVVRATPWAPPHDGVRLFLPALPFVAIVAGIAAARALLAARRSRWWCRFAVYWLTGWAYMGALHSMVLYAPHWLSYYNLLVGGVKGANALGMEVTYYWDGLDSAVFNWIAEHTKPGEKVAFGAGPTENLILLQRWGMLPFEFRQDKPGTYKWYVLQNRPGAWRPADKLLVERFVPVYEKRLGCSGWGPWQRDVWLVRIYHYNDYKKATELCSPKVPR